MVAVVSPSAIATAIFKGDAGSQVHAHQRQNLTNVTVGGNCPCPSEPNGFKRPNQKHCPSRLLLRACAERIGESAVGECTRGRRHVAACEAAARDGAGAGRIDSILHSQCRGNASLVGATLRHRSVWPRVVRTSERGRHGRRPLQVVNIGWDPENILAQPQPGHINRRAMQRKMMSEKEDAAQLEREQKKERERRRVEREARVVPEGNGVPLIEFFLELEAGELEFEIARCRARLNDDFFSAIKTEMGTLRFALNPNKMTEERLELLQKLETRLSEGIESYDKMTNAMIQAKDRLVRLLSAKDKKQTLLEMASENALDRNLLALLDENAAAAQAQGQTKAVEFLTILRTAVVKYIPV